MKIFLRVGLLVVILGLAVLFFVWNPDEHTIFPRCPFNALTGCYCPGCGSQRAIHSMLHLNFAGVLGNNFLFLPAVLLVVYHYIYPYLNRYFRLNLPNIFYFRITPWIILGVILLFWILRNLPYYPFSVLAPD